MSGYLQFGKNLKVRTRTFVAGVVLLTAVPAGLAIAPNIDMPSFSLGETVVTEQSTVPLLITMRNISQYHAATGRFQTLVERTIDPPGPAFFTGEHISVYAVGDVDAQVNFAELTEDNIELDDDRRSVTITLPSPTLTNAQLDPAETRVVTHEKGLFNRIGDAASNTPPDYRDIYAQGVGQLNNAARASDLVEKGKASTVAMLTGMCQSLGFEEVVVNFDAPVEAKG